MSATPSLAPPVTPPLWVDLDHPVGVLAIHASFRLTSARGALFGPSGAGKSTVLRVIAGLLHPQRGRIVLGNQVLLNTELRKQTPPGERGIGFLTQNQLLFPHLSVAGNLRFALHGLNSRAQRARTDESIHERIDDRIDELLRLFELETLRDRLPARLSGGERQRVALARTLAREPRLLLLDEPFSALDSARKAQVWATLDRYLHERGIVSLLVSHDASEVWAHADTVIRMEAGTAVEQGPPTSMLARERAQVLEQFGAD